MFLESVRGDDEIVDVNGHKWHVGENSREHTLYVAGQMLNTEWCAREYVILALPGDVEFVLMLWMNWKLVECCDHVKFGEELFPLKSGVKRLNVRDRCLVVDNAHVDPPCIYTHAHFLNFATWKMCDYWKQWHVISWPFPVFLAIPTDEFPILKPEFHLICDVLIEDTACWF